MCAWIRSSAAVSFLVVAALTTSCSGGGGGSDAGMDAEGDTGGEQCAADEQCDDGVFCNGLERCAPASPEANDMGCAPAPEGPCMPDQECHEGSASCLTVCDRNPDADGDGHDARACGGDDCDDSDPDAFPGNTERCDADGHDEDCDPTTLGPDEDGDGYVGDGCCNTQPDDTLLCGEDCNDDNMEINPDASEVCDEIDQDCDGTVDEGVQRMFWPDADGDGFGDESADVVLACDPPDGHVENNTDCNDSEAGDNTASGELCDDSRDNDCDGTVDEPDCAVCGDGSCDALEDEVSCCVDCGTCGDAVCCSDESISGCYPDCGECGDGVCTSGAEDTSSCCEDCGCSDDRLYECVSWGCSLGQWYFQTMHLPDGAGPRVIRGHITFTDHTGVDWDYDVTTESSAGTSSSGTDSATLDEANGAMTLVGNDYLGQLSRDGGFIALNARYLTAQTLMIRKGRAVQSNVRGTYRILSLNGNTGDGSIWGFSGTIRLDSESRIRSDVASSGTRSDGTSITFENGRVEVDGTTGEVTFTHDEIVDGGSATPVTFEGWAGQNGRTLLLTVEDDTSLLPVTILMVRRGPDHTADSSSGSYFITHFLSEPSATNAWHGEISLSGGGDGDDRGGVSGGMATAVPSGASGTFDGENYDEAPNGRFASWLAFTLDETTYDTYQVGQASRLDSVTDKTHVIATHKSASKSYGAPPTAGSLQVWVRRF